MKNSLKILFLGDIVGKPGRLAVKHYLEENKEKYSDYFIIANVENASHGFGLTTKNHEEFGEFGIHAFTSGNHIWDKKEVFNYIDTSENLIRPLNYPEGTPGKGYKIFEFDGCKIGVINLLGRVFMSPIDSPWTALETALKEIKLHTNIVFIDFHAEATAEKVSLGYFADNIGVSAIVGTHTHIQTADEKILKNKAAYITDVGFCGATNGVIGMDVESSLKRLTTSLPERFDVAPVNEAELNGVEIFINKTSGKAEKIKRIKYITELKEVK